MSTTETPLLEARRLSKSYGHVHALRDVSFDIRAGEILALLGDNGAGKSTLVKILSGLYAPDGGTLAFEGQSVRFSGPRDAAARGIATVYQDLALVDTRDVAANLFLGSEFRWGPFVNRHKARQEARALLDQLGVKIPSVKVPVSMLSGGQRQGVAVARALVHGAEVVIFDEPTAALGVTQTAQVLKLLRDLKEQGKAVVIVSHNLREIWDIADRFLVLHLGTLAGLRERQATTLDEIVKLIVYGETAPQAAAVEYA
jgi:ABC-type sugar transport system ATPase subunit